MIKENIIEFLRTGELTNFPFGTDRQTVMDRLGDNAGWTVPISKKDPRPAIIKYDQIEFYFTEQDNQRLYGIQITYSNPAGKNRFDMDYSDLQQSLNYDQTKEFLTRNNISFEETLFDFENKKPIIKTKGQVTFYFSEENRLQKFGRLLKRL